MNDIKTWHVAEAGHQHGPLTEQEVASLIEAERISRRAFVYSSHHSEWVPIESVEAFRHMLPPAPRKSGIYQALLELPY